jgi:RNA-directed DNA polymerase
MGSPSGRSTASQAASLTLNRRKTRVVKLSEPETSVDFPGYTFRYDRDIHGRPWKYLNACPSKKALAKERDALRELTAPRLGCLPIPVLIGRINRHLAGWKNHFEWGYSRQACRTVNRFISSGF